MSYQGTLSPSKEAARKSVRFGPSIRIREFPIILGDHPSATGGPPVCIDWDPQHESTANLDLYEYMRNEQRRVRPYLDAKTRLELVRISGATKEEIQVIEQQCLQIRKLRAESMEESGWDRFKKLFTKQLFKRAPTLKPNSTSARSA